MAARKYLFIQRIRTLLHWRRSWRAARLALVRLRLSGASLPISVARVTDAPIFCGRVKWIVWPVWLVVCVGLCGLVWVCVVVGAVWLCGCVVCVVVVGLCACVGCVWCVGCVRCACCA